MVKKIMKYAKFMVCIILMVSLIAPSYAALSASDGSAFVTKAEFDSALADFNARLTTFEAGINSKIDSQVTSYLDRNGIWNGASQTLDEPGGFPYGTYAWDVTHMLGNIFYRRWWNNTPNISNNNSMSAHYRGLSNIANLVEVRNNKTFVDVQPCMLYRDGTSGTVTNTDKDKQRDLTYYGYIVLTGDGTIGNGRYINKVCYGQKFFKANKSGLAVVHWKQTQGAWKYTSLMAAGFQDTTFETYTQPFVAPDHYYNLNCGLVVASGMTRDPDLFDYVFTDDTYRETSNTIVYTRQSFFSWVQSANTSIQNTYWIGASTCTLVGGNQLYPFGADKFDQVVSFFVTKGEQYYLAMNPTWTGDTDPLVLATWNRSFSGQTLQNNAARRMVVEIASCDVY